MERNFGNGSILFNGKTVSNCCNESGGPPVHKGTIIFTFDPNNAIANYISFVTFIGNSGGSAGIYNDLGTGMVDFGNGTILSTSEIKTFVQYPVGTNVILRSEMTVVVVAGTMTIVTVENGTGLDCLCLNGQDANKEIISQKITQIKGLSNCTSLRTFGCVSCSLSALDITPIAKTLCFLYCSSNTGLTTITG